MGDAVIDLDVATLRGAIQAEYAEVATCPMKGFHFHTGRLLAERLGYPAEVVDALPDPVVESFAGVGNPFALGALRPGEVVVDVGSGAGFDAVLAAFQVGPRGRVIGVDMTPEMVRKARANAAHLGLTNVEFRDGLAEALPLPDARADVVISNGVINLCPDKPAVYREIFRVLRPGGRIQIADIAVQRAVPVDARRNVDLWTG
ncbi:MAG: methyltransferase domain-containing protein [Thermomicrobiaceae bacterium]|nr:methyltransferase domain-containing protein [Thermomicrobiaceae bacterium]